MESFFLPKMLKSGAKLTSLSSPARNLKIYFCLAAILHALKTDENETVTYPNNLLMQKGISVIMKQTVEKEFFD